MGMGAMGQRRRYLAEQAVFMEELAKRDRGTEAQVAGGGALLYGATQADTGAKAINRRKVKRIEGQIRERQVRLSTELRAPKRDLRPTGNRAAAEELGLGRGRNALHQAAAMEHPQAKARLVRRQNEAPRIPGKVRRAERKKVGRELAELNRAKKVPLISGRQRMVAQGVLGGGGGLLAYTGLRRGVEKRDWRKRDVDAALVGSGAGVGAYYGGHFAGKKIDNKAEAKIAGNKALSDRHQAHVKEHGFEGKGPRAGQAGRNAFFRRYPKELPGARTKRLMAYTHSGRTGFVVGGATIAAGAYGAARASQSLRERSKVGKRLDKTAERKKHLAWFEEQKAEHQKLKDQEKAKSKKQAEELKGFTARLVATGRKSKRDPRKNKARYVVKGLPTYVLFRGKRARVLEYRGDGKMIVLGPNDERFLTHRDRVTFVRPKKRPEDGVQGELFKREPLKTNISERDAKRVTGRYGMAGPLPKDLTREQKMNAYEARYVASGGRKGEKWQRRAETADKVRNASLGVGTAAAGAMLAGRTAPGKIIAASRFGRKVSSSRLAHHGDTGLYATATTGGSAELYGTRARRKRASYASAPGGAAASALRRMRDMDAARRS